MTVRVAGGGRSQSRDDREIRNKDPYNDDAYMAQIEQYKDKSWYDQLLTNPWLWSKQGRFSPNLLQQFAAAVGDTSAADNYFNQIQSNQQQWLSEFLEKMRQEEYNNATSQVAQQKAAGLNPDLNGSVAAGSAAENDQPMLDTPLSGFGTEDSLMKCGQIFMSIYSLASGFAKDMMSFQSMANKLTDEDLDLNTKVVQSTLDFVRNTTFRVLHDDNGYYLQLPDENTINNYAFEHFSSRSARKRFLNAVRTTLVSAEGFKTRYETAADAEKSILNLAKSVGANKAFGFSHDLGEQGDINPAVIISEELNELAIDVEKYNSTYMRDYYKNADGASAAAASKSNNELIVKDNEARSYQKGIDKIVNESMERIIQKLEKAADGNSIDAYLAKGMLLYLGAMRLQMLPSLPSVNLKGLVDNRTMMFNSSE